jgi:hypothetical protein
MCFRKGMGRNAAFKHEEGGKMVKIKTSDKLYEVNANISLEFIALKQKPTLKDMEQLNCILGQIIKEIRILEEENERLMMVVKDGKKGSNK